MDLNEGNSNPLCSKNGLICSISGFTVRSIILSIFANLVSDVVPIKTGVSKFINE